MSARSQAREALLKDQEPERDRKRLEREERERQEGIVKAQQTVRDRKLWEDGGVYNWFPNVHWKPIAHYNGGTVFQSQEESRFDCVCLRLNREGDKVVVRFTPHERYLQEALNHWRREKATIDASELQIRQANQYSQIGGRSALEHHGWWGPIVTSAADVGRMIAKEDGIMSSMPMHLE